MKIERTAEINPGSVEGIPWATHVFARVLPESAKVVTMLRHEPSKIPPLGYVLLLTLDQADRSRGRAGLCGGLKGVGEKDSLHTALRRTREQLGLVLGAERFYLISPRELGGYPHIHWKYYYCLDLFESEQQKIDFQSKPNVEQVPMPYTPQDMEWLAETGRITGAHAYRLERAQLIPHTHTHDRTVHSRPQP